MFTEIYIEALLVNEEQANHVWEAWDAGEIDDSVAARIWVYIYSAPKNLESSHVSKR